MYDIIIVGAGPAGLTAALYALRANKNILILEAKSYGGQIIKANRVDNYPAMPGINGFDFANSLYNQVKDLGGKIVYETVEKVEEDKTVITNKNKYTAKAVILATGADNKKLNLENEINLIGKGVSYCATCDGNFFKGKDVAIIGGGNTALEDAIYLSNIVNKLYVVHRGETFRGDEVLLNELKTHNNVEYLLDYHVEAINGTDHLESIDVMDEKTNNITNIEISGLFIAVGQEPNNKLFTNIVDLDENGYFVSNDGLHTKVEGIYIAGDARQKTLRQLTTAVSDGSIAATTAIREMLAK
jgi:thioredoxin reductase (NADPH)